jgi:hypothetical protein
MKTAIERYEQGLQLFKLGAINEYEIHRLADEARLEIGLAKLQNHETYGFFARIGRLGYKNGS